VLSGFKGFNPGVQGVGRFDGIYGTSDGGEGRSELMDGGDNCGVGLASDGFTVEAVPLMRISQLCKPFGLSVSTLFPVASRHS